MFCNMEYLIIIIIHSMVINSINFVFAMNVMEPILRAILKVSTALQATELDLLNAVEIVMGLKKFILKWELVLKNLIKFIKLQ